MTHDAGFTTGVMAMDTLGRWRFAPDFKRELVERTLQQGASVAGIALAHQINAPQLFKWRRHNLKDRNAPADPPGPTLLPATMTPAVVAPAREAAEPVPSGTFSPRNKSFVSDQSAWATNRPSETTPLAANSRHNAR